MSPDFAAFAGIAHHLGPAPRQAVRLVGPLAALTSEPLEPVSEIGTVAAEPALTQQHRELRRRERIVFLDGTQALIASRLAQRKGHFMPPGLLESQFETLEPPDASENPVTVSIDASVEAVIDDIVRQLKLSPLDSGVARRNRA